MTCYWYGEAEDGTAKLNGFAAGTEGFARMCDEIKVHKATVELQLYQDGKQGSFSGISRDGRWRRWFIRRVGWEVGQHGE